MMIWVPLSSNKQLTAMMKVIVLLVMVVAGSVTASMAQTTTPVVPIPPQFLFEDTLTEPADELDFTEEDSTSTLSDQVTDSLMNLPASYVPKVSMELLADRLSCIEGRIPLTLNPKVAGFIDYFTVRNRRYTQMVLERKDFYFPIFEKYLKKHGLPDELKYLAIVESGLNFTAISRVGAVGLWQFMPITGKEVGLNIDHYFDERLHVERSTEAACIYLKRLYRVLGDWELVLASYNCGVGKVKRTVQRTGKHTFWSVYEHLPQETRAYVPQFVALTYAVNYYKEHNIYPVADSLLQSIPADSILVNRHISLPAFAKYLGVSHKDLKQINPTLRRHSTPPGIPYYLKYPASTKDFVTLNAQELLDSAAVPVPDHYLAAYLRKADQKASRLAHNTRSKTSKKGKGKIIPVGPFLTSSTKPSSVESVSDTHSKAAKNQEVLQAQDPELPIAVRTHLAINPDQKAAVATNAEPRGAYQPAHQPEEPIIQPILTKIKVVVGQGLFTIARNHGITIEQLCALNGITTKSTLLPGQTLIVAKQDDIARAEIEPTEQLALVAKPTNKKKSQARKVRTRTYQVQPGDTLWAICQKYEGVSVNDLIKLNGLKNRRLTPGQKLIVG